MNKLQQLFQNKQKNILSIYLTAGFPYLEATGDTILALQASGVDMIEVGMPYSDPMADGPTIQNSSQTALQNGMTLERLFIQLERIKDQIRVPLVFMGYLNPIMQYGERAFFQRCVEAGISGLIIPDLPLEVYHSEYETALEGLDLKLSFLIAPQTPDTRIRQLDQATTGFVYVVADASVTGKESQISPAQKTYFQHIRSMHLKHPQIIGFGIRDSTSFQTACDFANGAIIGSAFIRAMESATPANLQKSVQSFIKTIR